MLKILLASSLLLSAAAINAVASDDEANEYRETERYEHNERREYRDDHNSERYERGYRQNERGETHDPYREKRRDDYRSVKGYSAKAPLRSVKNELYANECGSCHFAYQSELLPRRSWVKMMGNLDNHFGTDATLVEEDRLAIEKYLVQNAGDTSKVTYKHYGKINNSIAPDEAPQRISQTRYFVKEHREIPQRLISQREVKSLSNCSACHTTAERGYYGERDINIPNHGRWED